jgi:hypothetical protein
VTRSGGGQAIKPSLTLSGGFPAQFLRLQVHAAIGAALCGPPARREPLHG